MNYGVKLKTLNNIKKTYESSMGHSKLASLSQRSLSSHNCNQFYKQLEE